MKNFFLKKCFKVFLFLMISSGLFVCVPAHAFLFWNFPKKSENKKIEKIAPESLTLLGAYGLALKKSESVALTAEEINQAQARFYRSFNYFLPSVHFVMDTTYRDAGSGGSSSDTSNAGRRSTPENRFTFTQPLFSGFREIAALQGSGADKKQQILSWRRARELLFVDVMSAYYAYLEAQKNVRTLAATHRLGTNRLRELDRKIKVGRLRGTDKQTSLADLKLMEADLLRARSKLSVAKNLFEFYIGETLGARVLMDDPIPHEVFQGKDVVVKARTRSDVAAAEQGYLLAEKRVIVAQANLFPTVSASGNYYTRRVGFQSGDDWDVTVEVDVPIFEMGKTLGDIKQAVSTRRSEKLKWEQSDRLASLDIQNALEDLRWVRLRERALWSAREASKKNYELISGDYNRSLVNNLDVLDALRRFEEVELDYNAAYFQLKESYWKLKVAIGEILSPGEQ